MIDRKQFTQINEHKSAIGTVKSGVPQGSKLASLFFLVYINDALKLPLKSQAQFYADDGIFVITASNFNELISNIEHDMQLIKQWFSENYLKLNLAKTKVMLVNNHANIPKYEVYAGVAFQGEMIERVEC